ncbi:hypothetical protein PG999_013920 [Apiospora kogelbergensis]|uniref:Uncharacterized protein n=1 Tax=Apiospora kogelbergensis TaxID=1337665 RepID=A0AAW0QDK4_9PEZI
MLVANTSGILRERDAVNLKAAPAAQGISSGVIPESKGPKSMTQIGLALENMTFAIRSSSFELYKPLLSARCRYALEFVVAEV